MPANDGIHIPTWNGWFSQPDARFVLCKDSRSCETIGRLAGLVIDGALGLVQVFLEIGHEGRAARSYRAGVAGMGLVLAMDVAIGVSDMDVAKLRQQIDARTVGIPKFWIV